MRASAADAAMPHPVASSCTTGDHFIGKSGLIFMT
jgi:hypothetical protein